MKWLERLHDRHHHEHRLRVLGRHLVELLPAPDARATDGGSGFVFERQLHFAARLGVGARAWAT
jgi:hypothetical protein